jgi:apolipoprotein D and lipocalin family protein
MHMKKTTVSLLLVAVFVFVNCQSNKPQAMIDKSTVRKVDLNRYRGTWYEIARFPHSFEKNLAGVTATYTLRDNGMIDVMNQGYLYTLDCKHKKAKGKAKIPDPAEPGRLKVSFFLFFYADYLILELDQENYQWVMIGSSSPDYFWILCREPVMDDELYHELLRIAERRGYDLSRLQKVLQPGAADAHPRRDSNP